MRGAGLQHHMVHVGVQSFTYPYGETHRGLDHHGLPFTVIGTGPTGQSKGIFRTCDREA